jgi:hypothetical protein
MSQVSLEILRMVSLPDKPENGSNKIVIHLEIRSLYHTFRGDSRTLEHKHKNSFRSYLFICPVL